MMMFFVFVKSSSFPVAPPMSMLVRKPHADLQRQHKRGLSGSRASACRDPRPRYNSKPLDIC